MLILITILVVLSAVITVTVLLNIRKDHKSLSTINPREIEPPSPRSLFEPGAEEVRALEREEKARAREQKAEKERRAFDSKQEKVREFREFWEMSPIRRNTIQLIYLASQSESGKIFSEIAENVIQHWQEKKLEDLSAAQLAQILESHFRLLPDKERTSGVSFWLKQEIAGLRRGSVGKN